MFRLSKIVLWSLWWGAASLTAASVYKGAIVSDVETGAVLFADQPDYVGPPASVTKLMTFLVIHDAIQAGELALDTPVTVTAADSRMGGTQVWLKHKEVFPVEELLYALMIQSANDAAHALSHAAGTTREEFVARMNARAQALGMRDTIWRTPHGLPPRSRQLNETDQTSPRDLARLSLALIEETDILRYTAVEDRPFGQNQRPKPVLMRNHNHLLGKVRGVDGLKTGFTRAAGFCLAATAERDGRRIIAVIMGSPTSQERDIKMAELIELGFSTPLPEPATLGAARPTAATAASETNSTPKRTVDTLIIPTVGAPNPGNPTPADSTTEPPTVKFELPY
jgi:D-alanyl-D-alanine carboxypeptidase (penicillin-binding protein 5/6)